MLSVFAFKLALLQVLPYIHYAHRHKEITYLTSSYSEVEEISAIIPGRVQLPYWTTDLRVLRNSSASFLLVDLPDSVPLCSILGYMTKLLRCATPYTVLMEEFRISTDYELIKGVFSLSTFNAYAEDDFLALLLSNNYDEAYIIQSFPSMAINMTQPLYAEDICKIEDGCRLEPDWQSFVGLSIRDVAITYGVHYGAPVAFRTMVNAWRASRGTISLSGMSLWGAMRTLALTPILTKPASVASSVYELAPMAAHPVSALSGIVTQTAQHTEAVIAGMRAYSSMPNLATTGIALSGAEIAATRAGAASVESVVSAGQIASRTSWVTRMIRALSTVRFRRDMKDELQQNEVRLWRTKRGIWSSAAKVIAAIPSWVTPSILSGMLVTMQGFDNLRVIDLKVKAFYPIVPLTVLEKFYATSAALILNKCFENSTLRETLLHINPSWNETVVTFVGVKYRGIDVVFDMKEMRAGPILHACTPMFKLPFSGLSKAMMSRSLSLLFSPEVTIDDVMYYSGLPQYIRPDVAAYINDVVPRFKPLVTTRPLNSGPPERRQRRAAAVRPPAEYGGIEMCAESTYTNAVQNVISHPVAVYTFDIITGQLYNTSADYYRGVKYYLHAQQHLKPNPKVPSRLKIVPGTSIVDLLTAIDPYSYVMPRINMLRELLDGYRPKLHMERIKVASRAKRSRIQHGRLLGLLALDYLSYFPGDVAVADNISRAKLNASMTSDLMCFLYKEKYARIPFLIVVEDYKDIAILAEHAAVNVRRTDQIATWEKYSPFVVTDQTCLIPAASYSLCLSKHIPDVSGGPMGSLFSTHNAASHIAYLAACDLSSLYLTYNEDVLDILTNKYLPARLSSILAVDIEELPEMLIGDTDLSSGTNAHDPLLSEIILVKTTK